MCSFRIYINPLTNAICLLLRIFLLRVCDGQFAFEDQMRGEASVGVWAVVGISVANLSVMFLRDCVGGGMQRTGHLSR
jgi:hypothetical protein